MLADRAPRRTVVVAANAALAVGQTTMGLLLVVAPGRVPVGAFVAAAAVTGAAAAATREGWAAAAGRTWLWTYLVSGAVGVPFWLAGRVPGELPCIVLCGANTDR